MSAQLWNDSNPNLPPGIMDWSLQRDMEGHRRYRVKFKIKTDDSDDGPYTVLNCPGLPSVGSQWNFGNDDDGFAWCSPISNVTRYGVAEGERGYWWTVEQEFTSKRAERCQDQQIEDPLLEPQKVSGAFLKYTEEATFDRFGERITNSAFEPIRGPQNEWDDTRFLVHIEQNVADLDLETVAAMRNGVNGTVMWGFPVRCVKLDRFSWQENYHGLCFKYYTRVFDFDINVDTWDRYILDEATKVLRGQWVDTGSGKAWELASGVSASNPADFIRSVDVHGNPAKIILNGAGRPYNPSQTGTGDDTAGSIFVQKYNEFNFFLLNLPSVIG